VPDAIFAVPRLAEVYDMLEGERNDLGHYLAMAAELGARRAWLGWNREATYERLDVAGGVETWLDVTEVSGQLVSYRRTYVFDDGARLTSDSTRRFRTRAEIQGSLAAAGYALVEVRDAPDRPGREWVFIARKPES
jgi:hypothetical protein